MRKKFRPAVAVGLLAAFAASCSGYTDSDHYRLRKLMSANQKVMFDFWLNTNLDDAKSHNEWFQEVVSNLEKISTLEPYTSAAKNRLLRGMAETTIMDLKKLPPWDRKTLESNFNELKRSCQICHAYFN